MRPKDTVAVKKAKEEHAALFKMIAKRNQQPAGKLQLYTVVIWGHPMNIVFPLDFEGKIH